MLFSLYDVKAGVFTQLFEARSDDDAKRMFMTLLRSGQQNQITEFPEDFILYSFGEFDNTNGEFVLYDAPVKIMTGFECVLAVNNLNKRYSELSNADSETVEVPDEV